MNIQQREKFEKDIAAYMKNSNIFKNNLSYLVENVLFKFEERLAVVSTKETAETEINNELDMLDTSIKLIFLNCTNTCRKDPNVPEKLDRYFADVKEYNIIKNYYILSLNEKMQLKTNGKNIEFEYNESFKGLEALNLYNKLNRNQNKDKKIAENFKYHKKTNEMDKDIYEYLRNSYLKELQEFDVPFEFTKYNIEEFYDVFCSIFTYVFILKLHNLQTNNFIPFYMDCDKLINKVERLTHISSEKVKFIMDDLTFEKSQKLDIICTPLIRILDIDNQLSYITSSALFLNNNIERNIIILLEKKYKISNKSFKEETMINEIIKAVKPYKNLIYRFNIKIPKENGDTLTDVDMVLYDKVNNSVIVSELKNFMRPDTVSEHLNIQGRTKEEGLNKATNQMLKIKDYYLSNSKEFLDRCFNEETISGVPTTCFLIISKNNLGMNIDQDIKILDTINFFELLQKNDGMLLNLIQDIEHNILFPKYEEDYWKETKVIDFAGYHITYPMFRLKHRYYT